jgi:hypothetical protein
MPVPVEISLPTRDPSLRRVSIALGELDGREVGVVGHRRHVVNGSGQWVAWHEGFAAVVDGHEMPGQWRDLAAAVAGIPEWVRYMGHEGQPRWIRPW